MDDDARRLSRLLGVFQRVSKRLRAGSPRAHPPGRLLRRLEIAFEGIVGENRRLGAFFGVGEVPLERRRAFARRRHLSFRLDPTLVAQFQFALELAVGASKRRHLAEKTLSRFLEPFDLLLERRLRPRQRVHLLPRGVDGDTGALRHLLETRRAFQRGRKRGLGFRRAIQRGT